ncbi:hypothetical protein [Aeromonas hydrophila]|uniref:hypothetical protein n=1 Tax=Aeromonas hydrophila TaxID=644 RepID=UPI001F07B639|nr:hypothetical protein [Aeromonas hydrophila]
MALESSELSSQAASVEFTSLSLHGLSVYFSENAINQLYQHKQTGNKDEAGGFLFGEIGSGVVTVLSVSSPAALTRGLALAFHGISEKPTRQYRRDSKRDYTISVIGILTLVVIQPLLGMTLNRSEVPF